MKKIAIYGLSTETEKALSKLVDQFTVIGLLDSFVFSGEMYGQKIISIEEVKELGAERIVVVARPGSCKAIAAKIGDYCRAEGIELYDIRGKDLLAPRVEVYNYEKLEYRYKKEELLKEIEKADVISFDLFDTLITRTLLNNTDIFEALGDSNFVNDRIAREKILSQKHSPKLEDIYGDKSLALKEFELEKKLLVPRTEMCELVEQINKAGKKVYITTDSFYSKKQIAEILKLNGIIHYEDILSSCEYDQMKKNGLFEKLIEKAGTKNILHIGDDNISDVNAAIENGIKSFKIYSKEELFELLGCFGIQERNLIFCDKVKLGLVLSRLFNSPFIFENENMNVGIDKAYDIGYIIVAALVTDFIQWFTEEIRTKRYPNVWLGARDGYLIEKVLAKYYSEINAKYFFTSRAAAIRSGVETKDDINYVMNMKYSGKISECIKNRFGIELEDLNYEKILENAKNNRINYAKYINSMNENRGDIAFFDFVAKGTTQLFLQKIVDNKIIGKYFLQLEATDMSDKGIEVDCFYSEEEREKSQMFDNYYILETVLTAGHASVEGFDDEGNPIFSRETRTSSELYVQEELQKGVLEFIDNYYRVCDVKLRKVNKEIDEILLGLVNKLEIRDNEFLAIRVEDPFFNRNTNMNDLC